MRALLVLFGALVVWCENEVPSYVISPPQWHQTLNMSSPEVPVNDDIADFAQYMKERKSKEMYDQGLTERGITGLRDDALLVEEGLGAALGSWGRRGGRQADEGSDSETGDEEAQEPQEPDAEESDLEASTISRPPQPGEEEASEDESPETEAHIPEPRFVKDKFVQLPEPMIYNDSHIVSSLVYSMIPFRSPLLSLLDPDRHAKYIMIKVDPVLSWSPARGSSGAEEGAGREARLEQTLIELLDRSIAHELGDRPLPYRPRYKSRPESSRRPNPVSYL